MDEALRYAGIALAAALAGLLIKRHEPTLALLLALAAGLLLLAGLWQTLALLLSFIKELSAKLALLDEAVQILLRVLGIVLVTKIGAQLCKDAGESALAFQLELAGNALALFSALPLFNGLFTLAASFLSP